MIKIRESKGKGIARTSSRNQKGELVVDGEATIMASEHVQSIRYIFFWDDFLEFGISAIRPFCWLCRKFRIWGLEWEAKSSLGVFLTQKKQFESVFIDAALWTWKVPSQKLPWPMNIEG